MLRADIIQYGGALPTPRRCILGFVVLIFLTSSAPSALAQTEPDRTPISREGRPPKRSVGILSSEGTSTTGWWFGSAGIGLVLAVCGGICLAAKKYLPQSSSPLLQVVGRVSLSPKHSVYLLRVDDRVLLIGAGAQGAPSYLGELPDTTSGAAGRNDFFPATEPSPSPRNKDQGFHAGTTVRNRRLDVRLGDES